MPRPSQFVPIAIALSVLSSISAPWAMGQEGRTAQLTLARPWVERLDAADFAARESAVSELRETLAGDTATPLVAELRQVSFDPAVTYEVRLELRELLRGTPEAKPDAVEAITDEQAVQLAQGLTDDKFTVRDTMSKRLRWLLNNPANIRPLMLALKQSLKDAEVRATSRESLKAEYAPVRQAWLQASPEQCPLPAVGDEEIAKLVEAIATSAEDEAAVVSQRSAIVEVEDLLVREDCRERATAQLSKSLAESQDAAATARLQELLDWTRPAMVAEIWSNTPPSWAFNAMPVSSDPFQAQIQTMQYLHIGRS